MRLQFQTPEKLRDRGIQHERIEEIDVIDDQETGARGIEAWRMPHNELRARQLHRDAAEHALCSIVLAGIYENPEYEQKRAYRKEKCGAE